MKKSTTIITAAASILVVGYIGNSIYPTATEPQDAPESTLSAPVDYSACAIPATDPNLKETPTDEQIDAAYLLLKDHLATWGGASDPADLSYAGKQAFLEGALDKAGCPTGSAVYENYDYGRTAAVNIAYTWLKPIDPAAVSSDVPCILPEGFDAYDYAATAAAFRPAVDEALAGFPADQLLDEALLSESAVSLVASQGCETDHYVDVNATAVIYGAEIALRSAVQDHNQVIYDAMSEEQGESVSPTSPTHSGGGGGGCRLTFSLGGIGASCSIPIG